MAMKNEKPISMSNPKIYSRKDLEITRDMIRNSKAITREEAAMECEAKDNSELQVLLNLLSEEQETTRELIDQIWGYLRPIIVQTPKAVTSPESQPSEQCLTDLNNMIHDRLLVQKTIVRTLADLRSSLSLL